VKRFREKERASAIRSAFLNEIKDADPSNLDCQEIREGRLEKDMAEIKDQVVHYICLNTFIYIYIYTFNATCVIV